MSVAMTTVTGTLYLDDSNQIVAANCILRMWPSFADVANEQAQQISFTLDGSGNVPGGSQVEDISNWTDQTGGYRVQLLDPTGTFQYWSDGPWKVTGGSFTVPARNQIDALE